MPQVYFVERSYSFFLINSLVVNRLYIFAREELNVSI